MTELSWIALEASSQWLVWSTVAFAYIGPGAGITAVGTVIALIGAITLAILGFVWYPIRRILRKAKNERSSTKDKTDGSR